MSGEVERSAEPAVIGFILPLCPWCGLDGDVRVRRDVVEKHRPDPIFGGVPYLCEKCNRPFGPRP